MSRVWIVVGAFLALLLGTVLLVTVLSVDSVSSASDSVERLTWKFMTLRWVLIGALWWQWDAVIERLMTSRTGQRGRDEDIVVFKGLRHRVLLIFVCVELFIVQNTIPTLIGWIA